MLKVTRISSSPTAFSRLLAFCTQPRVQKKQRRSTHRFSYIHRPDERGLESITVGHLLDRAKDSFGQREAVVDCSNGLRKTFQQLHHDATKLASGLINLGLNVGDRLGVWCPNRYEFLLTQFAASKAGLILVPLNPAYQMPEVKYCMEKMKLRSIVTQPRFLEQNYQHVLTQLMPELTHAPPNHKIRSQNFPHLDTVIMMSDEQISGCFNFEGVVEGGGAEDFQRQIQVQENLDPLSAAYVLFTSGTTGKPKGATLSHLGVVNPYLLASTRLGFNSQVHRILCSLPLFHAIGCLLLAFNALVNGNCVVLTGPKYNPAASLKAIEKERCSMLYGTPTMYLDLLNHPQAATTDLSSIKFIKVGGALFLPPVYRQIRERWKCDIMIAYGMTEATGLISCILPNTPIEQAVDNVGKFYEHIEVKIVDENKSLVPRGCPGEICVRSYRNLIGYWDDEEKTREAFHHGGWYQTGDVGILRDDDVLQIVDRKTDMIIRGGANIYPREIENLLMEHPQVAEAYVIAVPDARLGEDVGAWIRPKHQQTLTEQDIKSFCKGKITYYKIPKYIRFVEDFPRTISGKVRKNEMRKQEAARILTS